MWLVLAVYLGGARINELETRSIVQIECHSKHTHVADSIFTAIILFNTVRDEAKKVNYNSHRIVDLGPVQTLNFTCAESNANEKNLLFSLICIRFGTCEVQRLNRALATFSAKLQESCLMYLMFLLKFKPICTC